MPSWRSSKASAVPANAYDAATHRYWIAGERVPSVTQVLPTDHPWHTEAARARGRLIHELTRDIDLDAFDPSDVPEAIKGEIDGYFEFLMQMAPRWSSIEQPYFSRPLLVGGRPDRIGTVAGVDAVVDIKSGQKLGWHAWQTGGYDMLSARAAGVQRARFALYLTPRGKFKLERHWDRSDYGVFVHYVRKYHATF